MSNEELETRMEFIVELQAQFLVDMQQLRQAQAQTELVVSQTGEIVARLANVTLEGFNGALEGFKDVNAKIDALVDSQFRTDEKINALTDNVQNLTAIVDRYFTEGRNGN